MSWIANPVEEFRYAVPPTAAELLIVAVCEQPDTVNVAVPVMLKFWSWVNVIVTAAGKFDNPCPAGKGVVVRFPAYVPENEGIFTPRNTAFCVPTTVSPWICGEDARLTFPVYVFVLVPAVGSLTDADHGLEPPGLLRVALTTNGEERFGGKSQPLPFAAKAQSCGGPLGERSKRSVLAGVEKKLVVVCNWRSVTGENCVTVPVVVTTKKSHCPVISGAGVDGGGGVEDEVPAPPQPTRLKARINNVAAFIAGSS
jgi:hypothetical protein